MALLDRITNLFKPSKRDVYVGWTGSENWWQALVPRETASGVSISPEVAYQIGVVYACVNKIASTVAMLPIELVDESDRRFRFIENDIAVRLLNTSSDGELPSFYVRQSMTAMMLLFGRGYAWIQREDGVPVALHYSQSSDVIEKTIDGQRFYRVADRRFDNVVWRTLPASDVIVLRYLFSQSPVVVNRDTVGRLCPRPEWGQRIAGAEIPEVDDSEVPHSKDIARR